MRDHLEENLKRIQKENQTLKRIQKENQTLKRVRKGKKNSIYLLYNVIRFTKNVSDCFENNLMGCSHKDKPSFLDLYLFYFFINRLINVFVGVTMLIM